VRFQRHKKKGRCVAKTNSSRDGVQSGTSRSLAVDGCFEADTMLWEPSTS